MTPVEAKAISLEVWQYLAEHPEITKKSALPYKLWCKIKSFRCQCPLCNIFFAFDDAVCPRCPLKRCTDRGSFYEDWCYGNESTRKAAAQKIVDAIKAWEPEEKE